jgi:SAM-dependent methyltransferase
MTTHRDLPFQNTFLLDASQREPYRPERNQEARQQGTPVVWAGTTSMSDYQYVGSELGLFAKAENWKAHFRAQITPFLGDTVLEVGAGFGGTTRVLAQAAHKSWTCLEPDSALVQTLEASQAKGELPSFCQAVCGTLADVPLTERFDSILYIDVLEHIEDDAREVADASSRLIDGGHLIVLCPAHPKLFTPFDAAIGHFRRYNKQMMRRFNSLELRPKRLRYLDSAGLLASLGNALFLRQSMPTERQIRFWDRWLVPISRCSDPLTGYLFGKSILGIWSRSRAV